MPQNTMFIITHSMHREIKTQRKICSQLVTSGLFFFSSFIIVSVEIKMKQNSFLDFIRLSNRCKLFRHGYLKGKLWSAFNSNKTRKGALEKLVFNLQRRKINLTLVNKAVWCQSLRYQQKILVFPFIIRNWIKMFVLNKLSYFVALLRGKLVIVHSGPAYWFR